MAGRLVRDGDDLCFVPRFPFLDGTAYSVSVDGAVAATLVRATVPADRGRDATVTGIQPDGGRGAPATCSGSTCGLLGADERGLARAGTCGSPTTMTARDSPGPCCPAEHELWDA